ncbi:MAG: ribosome small subunit-dependent GTPase A [Firmicutes bacterium]|nr:ribosome small subunit-dependent GTPase A [Bacillota bacterium]
MNQTNQVRIFVNKDRMNESKAFESLEIALVIEQQKDLYKIIVQNEVRFAKVSGKMMYQALTPKAFPSVGDWVMVESAYDIAVIHTILNRKSILERKSAGVTSDAQIIATNIDIIFICMSLNENFNLRRLERYLSVCWNSGAIPVIVLTKADLTLKLDQMVKSVYSVAFGVDVLFTSEFVEPYFKQVETYLKKGLTYAFIGSSGVGKSTLVNHLLAIDIQKTEVVGGHDKGRHTTTSRGLYMTQGGSMIIDTPGMRELQLDEVDLETTFDDIEKLSKSCKFNDCSHTTEPGCAVLEAIESGTMEKDRLLNYQKLQKEFEYQKLRALRKERKMNKR